MDSVNVCYSSVLVVLVLQFAGCVASPVNGLYKLDIIHYNDFHARFEETSVETPTCQFNNNSCLGGFPRLYQEISTLLKEKPEALLLNAGDSFQGTYWYTLLKWNITQMFMNMLPHDAHAIGNHEFDDGPQGLAPYLAALKAPVLAANMDSTHEPILDGLYMPSTIVKRKGKRIGLIGLITTDTKMLSWAGKVVFTDPLEATKREADILTKKGVDIIIVLSHCGLEVDIEIARRVGQWVDVIVGGHTHSLLWNGAAPSGEPVAGPYPVFVQPTDDNNHYVLIVQASAFTKYMGNLSVYFDEHGDFVSWDGGPIFLNRSIPEDEHIKALLEPYARLVHEAKGDPLGESLVDMNAVDCMFGECAVGDMMADAYNEYAKSRVKTNYPYISVHQRENIKASIDKGVISQGALFEVLPYNDKVYACDIKGEYVRAALERSVSDEWESNPFSGPWLLQVSGIQVVYNVSKAQGNRIITATVDGEPLDDTRYYLLTVSAFLSNGAEGYTMLKNKENVRIIGRDRYIVQKYITQKSPLNISVDGRIKILH